MKFESRSEAGQLLAKKLKKYAKDSVVFAIPRGGVVVGAEIAKELTCPLDVIIVRKIGAPGNPELAIGATTSNGDIVLDRDLIDNLGVTQKYIHDEHKIQLTEARRRKKLYTTGEKAALAGKKVILVDDGIATGATIEAAIHSIRESKPQRIILAAPVAPARLTEKLKNIVEDVVVLASPESFWAIGEFYSSFPQVSDEEVIKLLKKTNQR